jgi:IS605 OrfB family transposase
MPILTIIAKVETTNETKDIILGAMLSATKVYNGLLWNLRDEFERISKTTLTQKNLNKILKTLPRAKDYYSQSVQATRDEVLQAYSSFFALRRKALTQHNSPGFRPKTQYSPLRYFDGFGFSLTGSELKISLGTSRKDKVKQLSLQIQKREDLKYKRVINLLLTYDKSFGLCAHLVVEIEALAPLGNRLVAVDLGETQALAATFDDASNLLYSGKLIKAIRRYWQKVRSVVKPPTKENPKKSKRYKEIESKEHREIKHLLHILSKDFVERCYLAGVSTIAIGKLTGIRENIDYTDELNQRLHSWSFAELTRMINYKADAYGMKVVPVNEAYSSKTCHCDLKISQSNRKTRGLYSCACGWKTQADVNASLNLFERQFGFSPVFGKRNKEEKVSPKRSSGVVATPVVLPLRLGRHMVYKSDMSIPNVLALSAQSGVT